MTTGNDIAAAATGIGVLLGQLWTIFIAMRGNKRSAENGVKLDDQAAKLDETRQQLQAQGSRIEDIHQQTGVIAAGKFTPGGR